ncbi:Tethering factor for nuclear proteasome sts1 [Smittium mucronatum]|uniref:Tethering factor for nuclear proteasome STS1 n=1 Tax=Smittium mucronatum TaxID=133383 RepID=A0A1R0GY41_9FUNG|nr:Tethering factor for nuclear proteasome sts1 [Smittium mucronatum]
MQSSSSKFSTFNKSNSNGFGSSSTAPQWGSGLAPISGFSNSFGLFSTPEKQSTLSTLANSNKNSSKRKMSFEDVNMIISQSSDFPKSKRLIDKKNVLIPKFGRSNQENNSEDSHNILNSHHFQRTPTKKKAKYQNSSPQGIILDKLLEPLEKKDLLQILMKLVENNCHLEKELRDSLPTPTIASACSQLNRLENVMQNSVPYSKSGSVYNEYTYNRLKPSLEELRNTIVMYVDHFCRGGLLEFNGDSHIPSLISNVSHPSEWFELLIYATGIVCRMPIWNIESFDQIRADSLKYMSNAWLRAIIATFQWVESGHVLGQDMVSSWEKR